jgi:hypothetical protein
MELSLFLKVSPISRLLDGTPTVGKISSPNVPCPFRRESDHIVQTGTADFNIVRAGGVESCSAGLPAGLPPQRRSGVQAGRKTSNEKVSVKKQS